MWTSRGPQAAPGDARRRPPFFYGWVIVGAVTTISAISMALAGFNFGLFIRPMEAELGISRATFGWALSGRQLAAAATSPVLGRVVDDRGARLPLIVSTLVTVGGMCLLPFIGAGWQLIAIFSAIGLFGGAGTAGLFHVTPVAKWFVRLRPRAMSIVSVGLPLGAVVFVPLTQVLIDGFGWKTAWFLLAGLGAAVVIPLALLVRRQPEDLGLLPDGASQEPTLSVEGTSSVDEEIWTVREAIRTPTFWQLVLVFSLVMLAIGSVGLHRIPHFSDQGISASLVSIATGVDAAAATVGTLVAGAFMQRFAVRYVGAVGLACLGGALLLTIFSRNAPMMFVSMSVWGFFAGAMLLLQNFVWADYFGRAHAGAVRGYSMPITLLFSSAGPPAAGYVNDFSGSYNPIWWVGIFLLMGGALVLLLTNPPRHRGRPGEAGRAQRPTPAAAAPTSGSPA